jgi:hypothetical protein
MRLKVTNQDMADDLNVPFNKAFEIKTLKDLELLITNSSEPMAFSSTYDDCFEVNHPYDY